MAYHNDTDFEAAGNGEANGLFQRAARAPGIRKLPVVGVDGDDKATRAQELTPFEKPFADSSAIVAEDGSLVGAIKISPANMSTAGPGEWARRVDRLAGVIATAVQGDVQFYNPVRRVDYEGRRSVYTEAMEAAQKRRATTTLADGETFEDAGLPMFDVLADLLAERASVVHRYQETTTVREYYVLVKVSPAETVFDIDVEGGFKTVPGIRGVATKRELRDRSEEETVKQALSTLKDRMQTLAGEIQSIEDIRAWPIGAAEFAQVVADHNRAANMFAYSDFDSLVRQAPTPDHLDASDGGDPYQGHITNQDPADWVTGGQSVTDAPDRDAAPSEDAESGGEGGGSESGGEDTSGWLSTRVRDATDSLGVRREETTPAHIQAAVDSLVGGFTPTRAGADVDVDPGAESAAVGDASADIPRSEADLIESFRDALTPWRVEWERPDQLELGESGQKEYVRTLVVSDWPDNPEHGMLEGVLNFTSPGTQVHVSTHVGSADTRAAEREISESIDAIEAKLRKNRGRKLFGVIPYPRHLIRRDERARDELEAMLDAIDESDYGLSTSNTYIECRGRTPAKLREAVSAVRSRMVDKEATVKALDHAQIRGFQSAGPNVTDVAEEPVEMLGDGISALFSWGSHNLVEPGGVSMGLHTDREDPTIYHPWERESGYAMGVFGKVGNGKTTTVNRFIWRLYALMAWETIMDPQQAASRDGLLTVAVDPLQEFAGLCQLLGGERIIVGGDTAINPWHWNDVDDEKARSIGEGTPRQQAERRAVSFIESYYAHQGIPLGEGEKRGAIERGVHECFERCGDGMDSPTPGTLVSVMHDMVNYPERFVDEEIRDNPDAVAERKEKAIDIVNNDLEAFKEGGIFSNMTHQTELDLTGSGFVYLDLQRFADEQKSTAGLYMEVLLNQVVEAAKMRDGPTAMPMDEAHYLLDNAATLTSLKQAALHHRHHKLLMLFSTQNIGEFFGDDGDLSEDGKIIFNNLVTKIYHHTDEISPEWAESLDLTPAEHDFIEKAATGQAILQVGKEGTYPINVDMSNAVNPREFALTEFDPSEPSAPEDLRTFLREWTDSDGADVCEWSWDDRVDQDRGRGRSGSGSSSSVGVQAE